MIQNQNNLGKVESCPSKCRRFLTWIIQLLLWGSIAIIICSYVLRGFYHSTLGWIIFGVSYFFYWIFELCSSTFSYLTNQKHAQGIHQFMKQIFQTPLIITFHVECYHYETRSYYDSSSRSYKTRTTKVTTFTGSEDFVYYSWRDVSGIFLLDSSEAIKNKNISFIKLQLDSEYKLFDAYTQNDLNTQRNNYFLSNRWRDVHMSTRTSSRIPGMEEHTLVKISDYLPPLFGVLWYLLFTTLTLAQFYKYYIDSFCSNQHFVIKKELSTRININDPSFDSRYKVDCPVIILRGNTQTFDFQPQLLHDTPKAPNEADLAPGENNKVWTDDIPNENEINNNNQIPIQNQNQIPNQNLGYHQGGQNAYVNVNIQMNQGYNNQLPNNQYNQPFIDQRQVYN